MSDAMRLETSVEAHEGLKTSTYKDSRGFWSTGIGVCLETDPFTGTEWAHLLDHELVTLTLTPEGARWITRMKLYGAEIRLAKNYMWWPTIGDARQNALIEMAFQIGFAKFITFAKMIAAIAVGDWTTASAEALNSDWAKETPVRAQAVAKMLQTGSFGV